MRHRKLDKRLGRSLAHRQALMASMACNLIREKRIVTTVAKAKQTRSFVEKLVTLARHKDLASRRRAISALRQEECVRMLFDSIAPSFEGRPGGYTRILRLYRRPSDSSEMAMLEWVGIQAPDKRKKKKKTPEEAKAAESK